MPSVCGLTSTPVTELATVICSPSRIHAAPRPATIRVWNGDQLNRSSRAGIVDRIVFFSTATELMRVSFRLSLEPRAELWMQRRRARPPAGYDKRCAGHHQRDNRGDLEHGRERN